MRDKLANALDECLELLHQGKTMAECLSQYSEYARELEPLLRTAQAAQHRLAFEIPADARQRVKNRVMAERGRDHAPRQQRWRFPSLLPRWAAVAVSALLIVVLGGAATVSAAGDAVPGEPLYPVKITAEQARLAFSFSSLAKARLHVDLAERRVDELQRLVERDETEAVSLLVARLAGHLEEAKQVGAADEARVGDLMTYLENSATAQLAILEQLLTAAPEKTRSVVEAALVTSAGKYGTAIETLAASAAPAPLLARAGTLQIFVTDPPPPDVDHVWVEVGDIEVHRAAGTDSRWITIVEEPVRFDLVTIVGVQEFIGSQDIEPGFYTQLRMNVTRATVVVGDEEHDAFVPSGRLEFVRPFGVKDGEITGLVLDFDGDRSLNVTGTGQYLLKPVVMLFVPESLPQKAEQEEKEEMEIEGAVTELVPGEWLVVNGQKVGINADTEVLGTLEVGRECEVTVLLQKDGTLLAVKVKAEAGRPEEVIPSEGAAGEEAEEAEIKGAIDDFLPGQWLKVDDQKVLITEDTEIDGTLRSGISCEVLALLREDGTLVAIEIKTEEAGPPEDAGLPEPELPGEEGASDGEQAPGPPDETKPDGLPGREKVPAD